MNEAGNQDTSELEQIFKDRYSNYGFLSQGGMGKVFTARDNILDKPVVIKILKSSFDDNQAFIRFQREAQVSSKLTHTNIVGTLDFGITDKNLPYIVMDFIEGESLQDILEKEETIPEAVAVEIACQIARGMSHAHNKGIVHRDLKTANIIISNYPDRPHATIIDFGLARRESQGDSSGKLTRLGTIIGTPLYMSPEQASGKSGDERSDIYSLGCILFKMLTGHTPFEGGESITIIREKTLQEAPPLTKSNPDISFSPELEEVVARALSLAPEERQRSMAEFEKELTQSQMERRASTVDFEIPDFNKEKKFEKAMYISLALIMIMGAAGFAYYLFLPNSNQSIDSSRTENEKFKRAIQQSLHSSKRSSLEAKSDITDEDLKRIARDYEMHSFSILELKNTPITGSGLKYISGLPVRSLDLSYTDIKPEFYKYVARMPKLVKLNLQGSTISGEGLSYLRESGTIRYLSLNSCKKIKDEDLILLKDLHLRILDLVSTPISDSGLVPLSTIKGLVSLYLDNNDITDKAFDILKPCSRMEDLFVSKCMKVTPKGLQKICTYWPDLKRLSIAYLNIKPEELEPLHQLRNLSYINMMNIPITDEDTIWMSRNKGLRAIYLSNTRISDDGIRNLTGLKDLRVFSMLNSDEKTDTVSKETLQEAIRIWSRRHADFRIYTDVDPSLAVGGNEILDIYNKSTAGVENSQSNSRLDF